MAKREIKAVTKYDVAAFLENVQIENGAMNPAAGTAGRLFFNTTTGLLNIHTGAEWVGLVRSSDIDGLAPIDDPVFTGEPEAPTPAAADNSQKLATTAFIRTALSNLVAANITDLDAAVRGIVATMIDVAAGENNALDTLTEIIAKIQANADDLGRALVVHHEADIGDGAATSFVINHGLNTRDISVSAHLTAAPYSVVEVAAELTTINSITIEVAQPPAASAIRIKIIA